MTKAKNKKRKVNEQISRAFRYHLITRRRHILAIFSVFIFFIVFVCGAWWYLIGQYHVTTEDAYVDGDIVTINAQISGNVATIYVDNTDIVQQGDPLIELSDTDMKLNLEQAKAGLAQAVRELHHKFALKAQLEAIVKQRQSEFERAESEYNRRSILVNSHAISDEDLQQSKQELESTEAMLIASQKELEGMVALIDNTEVRTHPSVLSAMTRVREAYIQLARTTVYAPVSGMVTKRNIQLGQHITPATSLMATVPLNNVWVNANFKESQLRHIRTGQAVILKSDVYGRSVVFHGKVLGVDAGTGSAFALLPAQNATGNWIKVVQRVPVRIGLDPEEVAVYPLRVGVSMRVTVNTRNALNIDENLNAYGANSIYETTFFEQRSQDVEAIIEQIIIENSTLSTLESQCVEP